MITKITQTTNGNIRLLDASDIILYQINRNKTVYLDNRDKTSIYIANNIDEHNNNPANVIRLEASQIKHVGGVSFSGTAQDLIDDLDSYFFG